VVLPLAPPHEPGAPPTLPRLKMGRNLILDSFDLRVLRLSVSKFEARPHSDVTRISIDSLSCVDQNGKFYSGTCYSNR
jgi:hypothetical protein